MTIVYTVITRPSARETTKHYVYKGTFVLIGTSLLNAVFTDSVLGLQFKQAESDACMSKSPTSSTRMDRC